MKILKLILGCLATIIVGFLLIGIIWPTMNYETRIEINRSMSETYTALNDSSKTKIWIPGLQKIKMQKGNWGEIGSKYQMTLVQDGKTYEMYETVTAVEPEKSLSFTLENDVLINHSEIKLTQKNPGTTELFITNNIRGKNIFWRSMFHFFKGYFKKSDLEIYSNFKKMTENDQ